ncbi:GtrA family protein [Mesorhizobium sp. M0276]|uniref:GtrA family protein n=1 Tax=Mesorhizobium sp. M0276 TaxID=2956928 RepID=UPI00333747F8
MSGRDFDDYRRNYADAVRRISTFAAVGAFNTAAFFVLANILVNFGLGETIAAYAAYGTLVPVSFIGHRKLTFLSKGRLGAEWVRFCIVLTTNVTIIFVVTNMARSGYFAGWMTFAIISLLIPLLNFLLFQLWVFAVPRQQSEKR